MTLLELFIRRIKYKHFIRKLAYSWKNIQLLGLLKNDLLLSPKEETT